MDAWCALSFWPVTEAANAPFFDAWLAALQDILGTHSKAYINKQILGSVTDWDDLTDVEVQDLQFAGALPITECLEKHTWLETVKEIAAEQGFFHWDLDFAAVFAKGGFDLQIGNPPWVRPRSDVDALLAETDPWFALAHKPTQTMKKQRSEKLLMESPVATGILTNGIAETQAISAILSNLADYPFLQGQQPDLYRGFMERTWENMSPNGVVSLIHPESHFTEKKAAPLRKQAYSRLRRHWQFINALMLFDIDDHVVYGVHTYSSSQQPQFLMASKMYHPTTAAKSLIHDGSGRLPGIKDDSYNWDLRPHRDRIIHVDNSVLKV